MHWLIATDLDGTLLDDGYDLKAAAAALDRQAARGHEIVLASSKTLDEMVELAALCSCTPALVFENGAGVAWPERLWRRGDSGSLQGGLRVQLQGGGYARLRAMLRALRHRTGLRFLGFADMSPAEIADLTGLSETAAVRARARQATEPVRWLDEPEALEQFRRAVEQQGYHLVEGGRFHHVMPRADKACAVRRIARRAAEIRGGRVSLLCCGDSANDLAMLSAADVALIFPRPGGVWLSLEAAASVGRPLVRRAPAAGAEAWSRAVDAALRDPQIAADVAAAAAATPGAQDP